MTDPPPRPHGTQLVVCGATGFTGRLTVEALRARNTVPFVTGRERTRLEALADDLGIPREHTIVADLTNASDVARVLDVAGVVVSTAGPFSRVGEVLVAGCASRGVHYVDSTGEVAFVQMVARRYDPTAAARGCALVCACAFEVAVADVAAQLAADMLGDDLSIDIAYVSSGSQSSRGTRESVADVLSRAALYFDGEKLVEAPVAAFTRRVEFAPPFEPREAVSFGSPECITVPRHADVRSVRTFMSVRRPAVLRVAASLASRARIVSAPLLRALLPLGPAAPTREQRAASRFQVVVDATSARTGHRARIVVSGRDAYGVSGVLLAEAALALGRGEARATGLIAPAQLFRADTFFTLLREFDVTCTRERT